MERRAGTRQGWCPACFNPRSRVGSDDRIFGNEVADHVSIHVPAWGATHRQSWLPVLGNVSIHAPAWGATRYRESAGTLQQVSIHAPAWGATLSASSFALSKLFQSTLPRGERRGLKCLLSRWWEFQSTLPRGERRLPICFIALPFFVSIHAPAWGATKFNNQK